VKTDFVQIGKGLIDYRSYIHFYNTRAGTRRVSWMLLLA